MEARRTNLTLMVITAVVLALLLAFAGQVKGCREGYTRLNGECVR